MSTPKTATKEIGSTPAKFFLNFSRGTGLRLLPLIDEPQMRHRRCTRT